MALLDLLPSTLPCPCCGGVTGCCNRFLPKKLYLTVGAGSGEVTCKKTFTLEWNGVAGSPVTWTSLTDQPSGCMTPTCTYDYYVTCNGIDPSFFKLYIYIHTGGPPPGGAGQVDVISTFTIIPAATCLPLFLPFTNTSVPGDYSTCGCDGVISRIDVQE